MPRIIVPIVLTKKKRENIIILPLTCIQAWVNENVWKREHMNISLSCFGRDLKTIPGVDSIECCNVSM